MCIGCDCTYLNKEYNNQFVQLYHQPVDVDQARAAEAVESGQAMRPTVHTIVLVCQANA